MDLYENFQNKNMIFYPHLAFSNYLDNFIIFHLLIQIFTYFLLFIEV